MIGKCKAFHRQRISESTDILITTKSSDRKITQTIQNMSEPPHKVMEPVQPVQMNIYKSNTDRIDLGWLHFDEEPKVQEKQQVLDTCFYSLYNIFKSWLGALVQTW